MLEELKSYLNKRDYACNRAIKFYQQGNLLASQLWKRVSNYYAWKAEALMSYLTVELCMNYCEQQ